MYPFKSRRGFIAALGGAAAASFLGRSGSGASPLPATSSPFRLSVITDEITQDFGHALEIASKEFGLNYVELRGLWKKNIINLDEKETGEVLAIAKALGTDRVRCFDFWRLDDPKPFREAMDNKLRETAAQVAAQKIILLLENEFGCNTATGAEAARTLQAVQSPNFKLNWDPGNAAYRGEIAFPDGFAKIPKERMGHMHCKDVVRKADGTFEWAAMGRGSIDYLGQFRALVQAGYSGTMSLETHWRGAGTEEESSRQSMAGMKELLGKAGAL